MASCAVDNDILIKLSAYRLGPDGLRAMGGSDPVGVLGAARYVVPNAIARHNDIDDREGAANAWQDLADLVEALEPSDEELAVAASIEDIAVQRGLQLDAGESQLMAITTSRALNRLATGDKRAIAAAEQLLAGGLDITALVGRLVCLEQLIDHLIMEAGIEVIRAAICAESRLDRALFSCMSCATLHETKIDATGIDSYINDLRKQAPSLLAASLKG